MKHLIISALLAVSLFVTAPAAQAADWNNDTLSCDIKVTDTWFGMWQNFKATFYVAAKPTKIYPRKSSSRNGATTLRNQNKILYKYAI